MLEILILEDIGFGHREHQYIFLHGILWAWSTSFRTSRKIIRQSNINNYLVQCAGTNRSNLVVHHDVVGMYGRCQSNGGCWQSKEAAGSWPILQEVVPRWAEASTAAGSRVNDCNLLAFIYQDTLHIFCLGVVGPKIVQMMPCRIGVKVECFTVLQDQGLMKENPDISCYVRCIF